MDEEFEEIYKRVNLILIPHNERVKEYKKDTRQTEALIVGIIIACLIVSFIIEEAITKYMFLTVSVMMFIFCTFYTFSNERKITAKQNKYSEVALSELVKHIKDGFVYEKEEELSERYYRESGFDRRYENLYSDGIISGKRNDHNIALSNIIVTDNIKELFKGTFAYSELKKSFDEIDVMTVNSKNSVKEKYEIFSQGLYMYSNSIRKSRKVITDDILADIKEFSKEFGIRFEFMINKKMIYFRFFSNEILTSPIANDKQTKEYLYKYYRIIKFIADFIVKIENSEEGK